MTDLSHGFLAHIPACRRHHCTILRVGNGITVTDTEGNVLFEGGDPGVFFLVHAEGNKPGNILSIPKSMLLDSTFDIWGTTVKPWLEELHKEDTPDALL